MSLKRMIAVGLMSYLFTIVPSWSGQSKSEAGVTVTLSPKGDDIAFDKTAIEVPFGKVIHMTFVNSARKDSDIIHNVAIINEGMEQEVMNLMLLSGYDSAKFPKPELLLARTHDLPPGEKETITFKPAKPGYYPYICTVKGHGNMMGMKGLLRIK